VIYLTSHRNTAVSLFRHHLGEAAFGSAREEGDQVLIGVWGPYEARRGPLARREWCLRHHRGGLGGLLQRYLEALMMPERLPPWRHW
jgi:hypothetical protein